jgi:hypothetical protein
MIGKTSVACAHGSADCTASITRRMTDNGAPGVRAIYHPDYGSYVLDPDGKNGRLHQPGSDARRTTQVTVRLGGSVCLGPSPAWCGRS